MLDLGHPGLVDDILAEVLQEAARDSIETLDDEVELGVSVDALVDDDLDEAAVEERLQVVKDPREGDRLEADVGLGGHPVSEREVVVLPHELLPGHLGADPEQCHSVRNKPWSRLI